jgi:hypothetical protein
MLTAGSPCADGYESAHVSCDEFAAGLPCAAELAAAYACLAEVTWVCDPLRQVGGPAPVDLQACRSEQDAVTVCRNPGAS